MKYENNKVLANNGDIDSFIFKIDFDKKLRKFNRQFDWNKAKHVQVDKKLTNHITFYTKTVNGSL